MSSLKEISNLYQNSKIREQSAPLLFSQLRNQNQSIVMGLYVVCEQSLLTLTVYIAHTLSLSLSPSFYI